MVRGTRREPMNLLAEPMPAGQGFLICSLPLRSVAENDYVCVGTEVMLVTSFDANTKRIDVLRGIDDTGTAGTWPTGSVVELNWRFPTADLFTYLGDEIRSWPDEIFRVEPVQLHVSTSQRSVDLPLTRFRMALAARAKRPTREWVDMPINTYRIELGLPTSQFSSGNAFIADPSWTDVDVLLEYAQAFDLTGLDDLATDTDDIGMIDTLLDAAKYGVAWRALVAEEAGRLDRTSQPEPRSGDEVKTGDAIRSASAYKALRDLRLGEEQRRLRQLYPLRTR